MGQVLLLVVGSVAALIGVGLLAAGKPPLVVADPRRRLRQSTERTEGAVGSTGSSFSRYLEIYRDPAPDLDDQLG